ncbi:MAG: polyhydroxybutyrate depolymerase [Rhodobacteraceae bacterium]|nr:polyhydroxybutyrate depolymerase [Paracoccaceae bacterium]
MKPAAAILAALLAAPMAQAQDCGGAKAPCTIETGTYYAALPNQPDNAPVLLWLHGAGGSGQGVMGNPTIRDVALERGYAVIAPNAKPREGSRIGPVWNFYPGWDGRDEPAFLQDVVEDAAARFATSAEDVLLAGFSAGGFMVSYLACETPNAFPAYAPVAGGFWRPHPDRCAGPVNLHHTHGWADRTVPLEGRPLGGGAYLQGDIFAGLEIWRSANGCTAQRPDASWQQGDRLHRAWNECGNAGSLEFVLHSGGHTVPEGWTDIALDWFDALATGGMN